MESVYAIVALTLLVLLDTVESVKSFHMLLMHSNNINFQFTEDRNHVGGAGRALHLLNKFRENAKNRGGPPVIYLNAGDNFSHVRSDSAEQWKIIAEYLNALGPDAMCLGNRDLDIGLTNLTRFLKHLRLPVVGANINFNSEKTLEQYVRPSTILDVNGHKIGIIGVTTTSQLPKGVSLEDEVGCVRRESSVLHSMGVDIIIVLSHSGYDIDEAIARAVDHVDIIVAGRRESASQKHLIFKHTIRNRNGKLVPIVHEEGYLRRLGMLNIYFDEQGNIMGVNGQPILLHSKIPETKSILELNNRFKREDRAELGTAGVLLTHECHNGECNYANLITDAMVSHLAGLHEDDDNHNSWTEYPIAIINSGTILKSVSKGLLTKYDITNSIFHADNLVLVTIEGLRLKTALEQGLQTYNTRNSGFLQVSGLHVSYNLTRGRGNRIQRLYARCGNCRVPGFEEVHDRTKYLVILNNYISISNNKDRVTAFGQYNTDKRALQESLIDVMEQYLKGFEVVIPEHSERITIVSRAMRSTIAEPVVVAILVMVHLFFD